jgi:hypothetical protein
MVESAMRKLFWLVLCCWSLAGCASREARSHPTGADLLVRHALEKEDAGAPAVFLPAELLEWSEWSGEHLEDAGRALYFIEVEPAGEVEEVMARRPLRRRGGPGGRPTVPLLNPRPTREEIAARRRRVEELRAVQLARERYFQALQEARSRYPGHQGYQEHHFIPIYLGGPRKGVTYRLQAAYHQAITQEFRRLWSYGRGELPRPAELQGLLTEVYSRYPIPQLIGLTP